MSTFSTRLGATALVALLANTLVAQTTFTVSGLVLDPDNQPFANTTLELTLVDGPSTTLLTTVTDATGTYQFTVPAGTNGSIWVNPPSEEISDCVSVYDLIKISRHILGIEPLNPTIKMFAADANRSYTITSFDLVESRKGILGIYQEWPNSVNYRFWEADYMFPNPNNPFSTILPGDIDFANLQNDLTLDITGILNGDVGNCPSPNDPVLPILSTYGAIDAATGTAEVFVSAEQFEDLAGLQFSMEYDASQMTFTGLTPIALELSLVPNNVSVFNGKLGFAWSGPGTGGSSVTLLAGAPLFKLTFNTAPGTTTLPAVTFGQSPTPFQAVKSDFTTWNVGVGTTDVLSGATAPSLAAGLQIAPNPATNVLNVKALDAAVQQGTLRVYDALGRLVKTQTADFSNSNTVTVDLSGFVPGTHYLHFRAAGGQYWVRAFVVQQ